MTCFTNIRTNNPIPNNSSTESINATTRKSVLTADYSTYSSNLEDELLLFSNYYCAYRSRKMKTYHICLI